MVNSNILDYYRKILWVEKMLLATANKFANRKNAGIKRVSMKEGGCFA